MTPEQKAFFQGVGSGVLGELLAISKNYTPVLAKAFADGHAAGVEAQVYGGGCLYLDDKVFKKYGAT